MLDLQLLWPTLHVVSIGKHCGIAQRYRIKHRCAGVIECVGIAIMVGLAVDYIVHMSAAIAHCEAGGQAAVQEALRNVGMSVISGAVTTIGASMFLLPCEMAVFQQFGAALLHAMASMLPVNMPCLHSRQRTLALSTSCDRQCSCRLTSDACDASHCAALHVLRECASSWCRHACSRPSSSPCATGTMVVITLSTALVFALFVFPAMCGVVGLTSPDTGSLRALFRGHIRAFFGRSRAEDVYERAATSGQGALAVGSHDVRQSGLWTAVSTEVAVPGQSEQGGLLHCQSLARSTADVVQVQPG